MRTTTDPVSGAFVIGTLQRVPTSLLGIVTYVRLRFTEGGSLNMLWRTSIVQQGKAWPFRQVILDSVSFGHSGLRLCDCCNVLTVLVTHL